VGRVRAVAPATAGKLTRTAHVAGGSLDPMTAGTREGGEIMLAMCFDGPRRPLVPTDRFPSRARV